MRFEGRAALVIGVLLPVLESYRRGLGHWRVEFTTMFEDYLAGALLIVGAWAAARNRGGPGRQSSSLGRAWSSFGDRRCLREAVYSAGLELYMGRIGCLYRPVL